MERRDARRIDDHHILPSDAARVHRAQNDDVDGRVLQPANNRLDLPHIKSGIISHIQKNTRGDLRRVQKRQNLARYRQIGRPGTKCRTNGDPRGWKRTRERRRWKQRCNAVKKQKRSRVEEWRLRREMERRDEVVHERNHIVDHHAHFRVVQAVSEII